MVEKNLPCHQRCLQALEEASCYPNRWGQAAHKIVGSSIDRGGMLQSKLQHNLGAAASPNPGFHRLGPWLFHSLQVQASKIKERGNLQDVVDAVTTAFYTRDSNTPERAWQALFHVFDATLRHDWVTTSPCLTLGRERRKFVRISRGPEM